jgi:hypothetical protein
MSANHVTTFLLLSPRIGSHAPITFHPRLEREVVHYLSRVGSPPVYSAAIRRAAFLRPAAGLNLTSTGHPLGHLGSGKLFELASLD